MSTSSTLLGSSFEDATRSEASLRRFLHGLPGVDQVGADARAASLGTRSIKTSAKAYALDLAIRMVDLTTLEGQDTPGKVRALASKAMRPDPADPTCPPTAAVCVYPDMVATAKQTLGDSGVHVAAVATAFPSGRAAMDIKLADTRDADPGRKARWIELVRRRHPQEVAPRLAEHPGVLLLTPGVAIEIFIGSELQWIDEDRNCDPVGLLPRGSDQRQVPGVESSHGRHERDCFARLSPAEHCRR